MSYIRTVLMHGSITSLNELNYLHWVQLRPFTCINRIIMTTINHGGSIRGEFYFRYPCFGSFEHFGLHKFTIKYSHSSIFHSNDKSSPIKSNCYRTSLKYYQKIITLHLSYKSPVPWSGSSGLPL